MGDIIYLQTLSIISGKNSNNTISDKDFELYPAEQLQLVDLNENLATRFAIPPTTIDLPFCTGTINQIKVLVIKPSSDLSVKLINANGTSQDIVFLANRTSVIHGYLTGLLVSNPTGVPIKGIIYMAGD